MIVLLLAYAYGGYRRQKQVQMDARAAGLPKAVGPATTAGKEFIQAIPVNDTAGTAPAAGNQLQPPVHSSPMAEVSMSKSGCGFDPLSR